MSDPPPESIGPGAKFGAYEVRARLGAGGQGHVFRAYDTDLRREVALKVLTGQTISMMTGNEAGGVAGTVPYMAPEVLRGAHADIMSDVWAIGVVLHEMTTGRLAFERDTPSEGAGGTPVNRTAEHAARDQFPSWSPDASQIAFWSDRDGGGCFVMPAIGGAARRVAVASFFDANPPVWSQDGRELSCVVGDAFRAELVTFSLDTGDALRRLDLPGRGRRMFVSTHPDGGLVAMIVSPAGLTSDLTELFVLNSATGQAERLTDGQTNVWSPVWSPDGSSLFYVSNAGGSADLWEQRLDKSGRAAGEPKAVSGRMGMRSVALSRDGKKLAYAQGRKVANLFRVPILAERQATWADAVQITFDQAVTNSLATYGNYLYFSWQEDLSDLWMAELAR